MVCNFQWDPNAVQTFNCDEDLTLSGSGSSFNKKPGTSFTMDPPGYRTLTLQATSPETYWGASDSIGPTSIEIKHGALAFRNSTNVGILALGASASQTVPVVKVENDGQFVIISGLDLLQAFGAVGINVEGNGIFDVSAERLLLGLPDQLNITVTQMARMRAFAYRLLQFGQCNIDISSFKVGYLSLQMSCQTRLELADTSMSFSKAATGALASPTFVMANAAINAADTATCEIQTGPVTVDDLSQFNLNPGAAKLSFLGFRGVGVPFEFSKQIYPQRLLNFTSNSKTEINGGSFVIQGSGDDAAAIVSNGLIAIDQVIQPPNSNKIRVTYSRDGLITVKQIAV